MNGLKFIIHRSAKVVWPVVFLLANQAALAAQDGGQRPAAYLEIGAGGVQDAMGGAAVADRNDPACGFWNPAGLSGLRGFQIETQGTVMPDGQFYHYLAFANGYRGIFFYGLSLFFYSAGFDLEARSSPTINPDSLFSDLEFAGLISVAFRLDPRWSIGGNVKVLTQNFNNYNAIGFGGDLGIQYRLGRQTTLGFMYSSTYFAYDNSTSLFAPPGVKLGIAQHDEQLAAKLNFDMEWSADLGLRPRLGVEWRPAEVLALRGGFWLDGLTSGAPGDSLSVNPTGGFGVLIPVGPSGESLLELDYSLLTTPAEGLLHQIDVTGKFL